MRRYDLACEISDGQAWMEESSNGEYVRFDDAKKYQDLESRFAELESEYRWQCEESKRLEKLADKYEDEARDLAAKLEDLQEKYEELTDAVEQLLLYATIEDGPAFEGRDALERIRGIIK